MIHDAPVVLPSSVTLARGQGGIDVNLSTMQSTSRDWLRIDEIRVWIDPGTPYAESVVLPESRSTDLGFIVDVSLKAGNQDLTSGFIGTEKHPTGERIAFIPAFLLGPRIFRRFSTFNNYNLYNGDELSRYAPQNGYVWTLPRPLYLPPGTPLAAKFRRTSELTALDDATVFPSDFTVEIAAIGIRLAKPPTLRTRCLPHLHGWSPRNSNTTRVESGEAFRNLYQESMVLTRMTGGVATYYTHSYGQSYAAGEVPTDDTLIQIYDANNQDILTPMPPVPLSPSNPNAAVPFSALFLAKTNSFRVSDRLKANQTYRAVVSPVVLGGDRGDIYSTRLPMLGLESFREVQP